MWSMIQDLFDSEKNITSIKDKQNPTDNTSKQSRVSTKASP